LAYLIDPDIPKNDGAFRPLRVIAREGTVAWARSPAPVTLCTNHCAQEIAEAVIKALARACPERAMAGWGRRFRIALQGTHPRTGRPFIWHMFQARPGGGASAAGDGWPTAGEWQAAGGIKFGSLEVTEVRFPLFFRRHEFLPDTGGQGRYRGGVGAVLEFVVETRELARANTAGDGVRHGACGMAGGQDGRPHRYRLLSNGHSRELQTKEVGVRVEPGDVFLVESGGGGGWGEARKRPAEARAADEHNGFVTRRRGRKPRAR
ncbi:MAG TPA: hydantoinase B/oxoprolinase family protein, partial [Methylomirabilota bacterium]|nr:hydantoinase B/oxoprolinase family protein [Methylomirabilota bacterium]